MKTIILSFIFLCCLQVNAQNSPVLEFSGYLGLEATGDYTQRYGATIPNQNDFTNGFATGLNVGIYSKHKPFMLQTGIELSNRTAILTFGNLSRSYYTNVIRYPLMVGYYRDFKEKDIFFRLLSKVGIDFNQYVGINESFPQNNFLGINTEIALMRVNPNFKIQPALALKAGIGLLTSENNSLRFVKQDQQFIHAALVLRFSFFTNKEEMTIFSKDRK